MPTFSTTKPATLSPTFGTPPPHQLLTPKRTDVGSSHLARSWMLPSSRAVYKKLADVAMKKCTTKLLSSK